MGCGGWGGGVPAVDQACAGPFAQFGSSEPRLRGQWDHPCAFRADVIIFSRLLHEEENEICLCSRKFLCLPELPANKPWDPLQAFSSQQSIEPRVAGTYKSADLGSPQSRCPICGSLRPISPCSLSGASRRHVDRLNVPQALGTVIPLRPISHSGDRERFPRPHPRSSRILEAGLEPR